MMIKILYLISNVPVRNEHFNSKLDTLYHSCNNLINA